MRDSESLDEEYDFIVCGGGTSGCVVARRLAEAGAARILLVEAGSDERVEAVSDARLWMQNIGSSRDWGFVAEPCVGLGGRRPPLPAGKVLGGGSSINGGIWARGHRSDFEGWAKITGDSGWGYASVLETYRRIEHWDGPPDPARRGRDGPVYVTRPRDPVPLTAALMQAAARAGIPAVDDLNGEAMEGPGACGVPNVTVMPDGRRVSMASAYLRPVMELRNLTVLLNAQVERVWFEGSRAAGVEIAHDGRTHRVRAGGEIILALGAIHTPKVLMLSGIGDAQHLGAHGIAAVEHLPGVGRNFQDHILVGGCVWEYRIPEPPRNNAAEFTLFAKSRAGLSVPDLQPMLEECAFGSELTHGDLPADPAAAWTLAPGLVRPHSRGRVSLTGPRPRDPVSIDANFLADSRDVAALIGAVELCREIGNSQPLEPFVRRELMPGPLKGRALEEWLRRAAGTYFHPAGTARMGREGDPESVVDGRLRVHGIDGLRIADASIMPSITTGNTMAPCAMIGERAAALALGSH